MQFDRALTPTTTPTPTTTTTTSYATPADEGSFLAGVLVAAGLTLMAAALITGILVAAAVSVAIGIGIAIGGVIQSTLFFGLAHVVARCRP